MGETEEMKADREQAKGFVAEDQKEGLMAFRRFL
jgi:hypothetical protein